MIAKAKSISHSKNSIDYAMSKENAEVIDKRFVVGDNGKEISNEFKIFQDMNGRCENNTLSFVLSPEPSDGRKLTNSDFKAISEDFLKEMKLDKHQAVIVKHGDKKHIHLHLYVNRIDYNGNAYKDNFISKKSQSISDTIARDRNLTRAKDVQELNKLNTKEIRREIHSRHKAVLQHKPKNFKEYSELMKASKIDITPSVRNGKIQGFNLEFQGNKFKASAVHRNMSFNKVELAIKAINKSLQKGLNYGR
ncbi:MAG TPA: mobilization protein [Tenacibaculum sp.]|jgi:hypothetical protein|nr:mobilization protein [Tenacibaculum sp.]HBI40628.1 mobilization protein [Tenacibaculum sp.]